MTNVATHVLAFANPELHTQTDKQTSDKFVGKDRLEHKVKMPGYVVMLIRRTHITRLGSCSHHFPPAFKKFNRKREEGDAWNNVGVDLDSISAETFLRTRPVENFEAIAKRVRFIITCCPSV